MNKINFSKISFPYNSYQTRLLCVSSGLADTSQPGKSNIFSLFHKGPLWSLDISMPFFYFQVHLLFYSFCSL